MNTAIEAVEIALAILALSRAFDVIIARIRHRRDVRRRMQAR
jgi:hypothetical protein